MTVAHRSQWSSGNVPYCYVRGGSNYVDGSSVYHDSHREIQPLIWDAYPYSWVDSAIHGMAK